MVECHLMWTHGNGIDNTTWFTYLSHASFLPSFLQAVVNYEQVMVKELQDHNEALQVHLMASEGANEEIYNRINELLTAHVMVCLERDKLRRFRAISSCIIVVLITIMLFRVKFN